LYVGDDAAALRDARTLLAVYPRNWMALSLLRNADLASGRYEIARSRYARSFSELTDPEIPQVDSSNYSAAIDLALVLIRLGEQTRADDLLDGSLKTISTMPRLGDAGYWIADVRIYALQQHPQRALDALQQAIDEGWRFLAWWHLQYDPNLDSIRGEPRFQRLNAELQRDLAVQVRRVKELKASGDLS
jgi:tetratricopeptide (TPR) repeat protein